MKNCSSTLISNLLLIMCLQLSLASTVKAELFGGIHTVDGEPTSLDEHIGQGKWTLVMFWTTDCISCAKQKPRLSELYEKRRHGDLTVIGVALDGLENKTSVLEYLAKHHASFPNFISNYKHIGEIYDDLTRSELRGTPTYLMYNPAGELVGNQKGPISPKAIERFISDK